MNLFFTKLQADVPDVNHSEFKGKLYFQYKGSSLSYYYINSLDLLKSILPDNFFSIVPHTIRFVEITDNETVPPHKDYGVECSINFYFNPGTAEVSWYTAKDTAVEKVTTTQRTRLYNLDQIVLADKFVAEKNSCYLFNNSQIHSVSKQNDSIRQFIQIQYYQPYAKILEKLGAPRWS
jgi:hypothetical protein